MADVLQDYLVSIRYAVDSASQRSFLEGLKRIATSVGGITAELAGLATGIIALSRALAQAGEQLYFMSSRLGSSVSDIEAATTAMTMFGVSTDQARSSMEALGSFSRSYGPAATNFLRSLGVTATDTVSRMRQLAPFFARMGGRPGQEGTQGYAMALQYAHMLGIDEMTMRALGGGQYEQQVRQQQGILERIFGVQNEADLRRKTDLYAAQSHTVMNQFRQFTAIFDGLRQRFAAGIFPQLIPQLDKLLAVLMAHLPQIERMLDALGRTVVWFVEGLTVMVHLFGTLVDLFDQLDPQMQMILGGMAALRVAVTAFGMALLRNPLVWFVGLLTTLLLLLDDYNAWQQHRPSAYDWSGFDSFKKQIDGWVQSVTGLKSGFWDIAAALAAIVLFIGPIGRLVGLFGGLAGAVSRSTFAMRALVLLMRASPWLMTLLLGGDTPGAGTPATPEQQADAQRRADEINQEEGYTGNFWHDLGVGIGKAGRWIGGRISGSTGGGGVGPEGPPANAAGLRDRVSELLGIPKADAAAMVSNFSAESGLRADITEGGGGYSGEGGTGGYGLGQWTGQGEGGRRKRLETFARDHGLDVRQESTQLAFLKWELATYYPDLLRRMQTEPDVTKKAAMFHREYEAGNYAPLLTASEIDKHTRLAAQIAGLPDEKPLLPAVPSAAAAAGDVGGKKGDVTIHQQTTVHVAPGPTAGATAGAVAREQGRVNEGLVRNVQGAVR